MKFINLNEYSPLVLAYLGDGVIEILVREKLVKAGNIPPEHLHLKALLFVQATAQSKALDNMLPRLSEFELDIYKRGRNAKSRVPKSASPADYRRATGMECLFGYLYLAGEHDRISELFDIAFGEIKTF
ncbi:MAG: Mini-ribonuclease 3 [Oscillospiraceae bacterium]|nr:Mini-ribonuclease 3 [Oscillospiraceae bacterium]